MTLLAGKSGDLWSDDMMIFHLFFLFVSRLIVGRIIVLKLAAVPMVWNFRKPAR